MKQTATLEKYNGFPPPRILREKILFALSEDTTTSDPRNQELYDALGKAVRAMLSHVSQHYPDEFLEYLNGNSGETTV